MSRGGRAFEDETDGGNGRAGRLTTMRDIARETHTRVAITPETHERVTLAARRLGYRPNSFERGLRGAPTMLIGVASTDTLAFGVLHAAHALGRRVPDDLSVVGFDEILLASHTVPALTTPRMPAQPIVGEGLDIAIELARNPGRRPQRTVKVIAPELSVRQSAAASP